MQTKSFLRVVRLSAWYDLLVSWPFATPWTFVWVYGQIATLSASLGLQGAMPELNATHILFANLFGSVVLVWSLARLSVTSVRMGVWMRFPDGCLQPGKFLRC